MNGKRSDRVKPRLAALMRVWSSVGLAAVLLFLALGLTACAWEEAAVPGTIVTVVGLGVQGTEGADGPAPELQLRDPVDLAFDAAGNLYIAESSGSRILKVDPSGILAVVAGTGRSGFSGDGGPASEAQLNGASAIAVGPDGNLYIADMFNLRIRMVDRNGIIATIAGTGEPGFLGDGGPATQAQFRQPMGMALDPEGNLYVWDEGNLRIRMVDPNGTMATVAGIGKDGFSPDGTPATELLMRGSAEHVPIGLAFDPVGTLHFTDFAHSRIRMIDPNGLVQTVAGNGENEFSGDGGPATEAGINLPTSIAFDANGNLYIATHSHGSREKGNRIRMVDRNGIITTIAGTEMAGYSGDGGPATEADLNLPTDVAIGPDGDLYIADGFNDRVRKVTLAPN